MTKEQILLVFILRSIKRRKQSGNGTDQIPKLEAKARELEFIIKLRSD